MKKEKIKDLQVHSVLARIYNGAINDAAIKNVSKKKLEEFVLEVFNHGMLNSYLHGHFNDQQNQ